MDFGKIDAPAFDQINFTLPEDHPFNRKVLSGKRVPSPGVYVGCPIWANREWIGKIYPSGTREKDYLRLYARQFNTIELNTTHYRIPDSEKIERWKQASSPGFTFCPKIPQLISHERQLQSVEALTEEFCLSIAGLGEYLGISFLQLPPYFGPKNWPSLENFLGHFPSAIPLAVEFRHPDWFEKNTWAQTLERLNHYRTSTVMTDVAGRRDVLHQSLSTRTAVIRYVGNMRQPQDYSRLDAWANRLKAWLDQGVESIFFFVHEHDNIISPEVARHLIRQLNRQAGLDLAEPAFVVQTIQGKLF